MQADDLLLDEAQTVRALGALAQPVRLRVFRVLVRVGIEGRTPGALSEELGLSPSGLSFHLKELTAAGLVLPEQRGRNLVYRAQFDRMLALVGYLTEHCCGGEDCGLPADDCRSC